MLTREQIEEIQAECREKGITIKDLLKEKLTVVLPRMLTHPARIAVKIPSGPRPVKRIVNISAPPYVRPCRFNKDSYLCNVIKDDNR